MLSAAMSVAMLKRPGVPPLEAITQVRKMVGAASRAWVRDFKIRGGRCGYVFFCTIQFLVCSTLLIVVQTVLIVVVRYYYQTTCMSFHYETTYYSMQNGCRRSCVVLRVLLTNSDT